MTSRFPIALKGRGTSRLKYSCQVNMTGGGVSIELLNHAAKAMGAPPYTIYMRGSRVVAQASAAFSSDAFTISSSPVAMSAELTLPYYTAF
jgi:hypothetical protein